MEGSGGKLEASLVHDRHLVQHGTGRDCLGGMGLGAKAHVFFCVDFLPKSIQTVQGGFPSSIVKFRDGCIMRYHWLISPELSQTSTGE